MNPQYELAINAQRCAFNVAPLDGPYVERICLCRPPSFLEPGTNGYANIHVHFVPYVMIHDKLQAKEKAEVEYLNEGAGLDGLT